MKKLITTLFVLLSIYGYSQKTCDTIIPKLPMGNNTTCRQIKPPMKIGNIEIDGETAASYLLDCYERPDTIKEIILWWSEPVVTKKLPVKNTNPTGFQSGRSGQIMRSISNEEKKLSIGSGTLDSGESYVLIPRHPSEIDYIKWLHNRK